MLTIEVDDRKTLRWLQAHQRRLDDTVILALPKVAQIARRYAPKKSGDLRRGIIVMPGLEKSRYQGKAVGQVVIDRAMNSVFQKPSKKGHHYYYPASQEYGFRRRTKDGGTKRIEGKHYMFIASRLSSGGFEAAVDKTVRELVKEME